MIDLKFNELFVINGQEIRTITPIVTIKIGNVTIVKGSIIENTFITKFEKDLLNCVDCMFNVVIQNITDDVLEIETADVHIINDIRCD